MSQMSIPNFPNVSLVAFYQNKSPELTQLIQFIQHHLYTLLPETFVSLNLESIHATLLGCEGLKTEFGVLSKWYLERRGESRYFDLSGFLNWMQHPEKLPLNIQFGGYTSSVDYGFLSQGVHPYQRSINIQNQLVVLRGWPVDSGKVTEDLDQIRRNAQNFNFLHKYHHTPDAVDNDCYMRIGTLQQELPTEQVQIIEHKMQEILSQHQPIYSPINRQNLVFIRYEDVKLPPQTTKAIPLAEATVSQLENLYPC